MDWEKCAHFADCLIDYSDLIPDKRDHIQLQLQLHRTNTNYCNADLLDLMIVVGRAVVSEKPRNLNKQ